MFNKKISVFIFLIITAISATSFAAGDLPYKEDQILVRFSTKTGGLQRTALERNQVLASNRINRINRNK